MDRVCLDATFLSTETCDFQTFRDLVHLHGHLLLAAVLLNQKLALHKKPDLFPNLVTCLSQETLKHPSKQKQEYICQTWDILSWSSSLSRLISTSSLMRSQPWRPALKVTHCWAMLMGSVQDLASLSTLILRLFMADISSLSWASLLSNSPRQNSTSPVRSLSLAST